MNQHGFVFGKTEVELLLFEGSCYVKSGRVTVKAFTDDVLGSCCCFLPAIDQLVIFPLEILGNFIHKGDAINLDFGNRPAITFNQVQPEKASPEPETRAIQELGHLWDATRN